MYENIYIPLDNSDHSNTAGELGLALCGALGARFVGSHAYAAALHDVRFKQMEFTLPDEYKDETELEKQRRIHDALITRGLTLISDSYLDQWKHKADRLDVAFEGRHFDGKNFQVIADDIEQGDYDLIVLGALGQGAVRDSQVGSVCERLLRRVRRDTLVVRSVESAKDGKIPSNSGHIVVCFDGSPHSWGALSAACELAAKLSVHVEIVTVQPEEPDASEEALLRQHVKLARQHARDRGVSVSATALEGATVAEIAAHLGRVNPWLVAAGRIGLDAASDTMDIGSVTERLVRTAPCNVLVVSRTFDPVEAVAVAGARPAAGDQLSAR